MKIMKIIKEFLRLNILFDLNAKSIDLYVFQIQSNQISIQQAIMYNSKPKATCSEKLISNKKPYILNKEMIKDIYNKAFFQSKSISKIKGKTLLKIKQNIKKTFKNKLTIKTKQPRKISVNKWQRPFIDINRQNKKSYEQMLKKSESYQILVREMIRLKKEQFQIKHGVKRQINQISSELRLALKKSKEIEKLKNNLINQSQSLQRVYNDLRLQNYEMRCQLCARGYQQRSLFYDTAPYLDDDQLDYEDLLELQEEMGKVEVGYPPAVIQKMIIQKYKQVGDVQQKCCICCNEFEQSEDVFTTQCGHVHHYDCIRRWLKIKRICPLCRNQIKLI